MRAPRSLRLVGPAVALGVALVGAPASPVASGRSFAARGTASVLRDPRYGAERGTSTHWSGYAVSGTNAAHVIGTWTVPAIVNSCAGGETSWSSAWVGIDGDVSNTVEQVGTDSDCRKGTPVYYAWYELYPKSAVTLPLTVHPLDTVTGEVTYASGTFTLTFTDTTTNAPPFTTTQQSKRAQLSSVEWILEGPANQLLSNFGTVSFTGASATIGGQSGGVGDFGDAEAITMVSKKGVTRAVPNPPTNPTSFSIDWKHA